MAHDLRFDEPDANHPLDSSSCMYSLHAMLLTVYETPHISRALEGGHTDHLVQNLRIYFFRVIRLSIAHLEPKFRSVFKSGLRLENAIQIASGQLFEK